jgi:acylphosphatase
VAGWVSNRPDGSVETVFEGEPEAVAEMVRFCERGPRGADVARVDVSEEPVEGLSGFDIR